MHGWEGGVGDWSKSQRGRGTWSQRWGGICWGTKSQSQGKGWGHGIRVGEGRVEDLQPGWGRVGWGTWSQRYVEGWGHGDWGRGWNRDKEPEKGVGDMEPELGRERLGNLDPGFGEGGVEDFEPDSQKERHGTRSRVMGGGTFAARSVHGQGVRVDPGPVFWAFPGKPGFGRGVQVGGRRFQSGFWVYHGQFSGHHILTGTTQAPDGGYGDSRVCL